MRLSDDVLLKLSLAVALVGVGGLVVLALFLPRQLTPLGDLLALPDEETVTVRGTLIKVDALDTRSVLVLKDTCTVRATLWEGSAPPVGSVVVIEGTLTTYKGKRELSVERLTVE
jgi:hypothetical protein